MYKLNVIVLILAIFFSFGIYENKGLADDHIEPAKWAFIAQDSISKKGCFIELSVNGTYAGHGSGTLISVNNNKRHPKNKCLVEAIVVTCNHVTPERSPMISVKWQDGSKHPAMLLARDTRSDVSILKTWVKAGTKPAALNILPIQRGTKVRCFGYGGITDVSKPRYFEAEVLSHDSLDSIIINEDVVPGDSGGGIFNEKGQLVGLIAHGNSRFQTINGVTFTPIGQGTTAPIILKLLKDYTERYDHFYSEQQ